MFSKRRAQGLFFSRPVYLIHRPKRNENPEKLSRKKRSTAGLLHPHGHGASIDKRDEREQTAAMFLPLPLGRTKKPWFAPRDATRILRPCAHPRGHEPREQKHLAVTGSLLRGRSADTQEWHAGFRTSAPGPQSPRQTLRSASARPVYTFGTVQGSEPRSVVPLVRQPSRFHARRLARAEKDAQADAEQPRFRKGCTNPVCSHAH